MNRGKYGIGEYVRFQRWEMRTGMGMGNRYQTIFILWAAFVNIDCLAYPGESA